MNPDLDTLATALYVTVDDLLLAYPEWVPERPVVGIVPKLSDAELVTLAVIQALLGYTSEARFLRYARTHLRPWFPYLPTRPAYNKRLRRSSGDDAICHQLPNQALTVVSRWSLAGGLHSGGVRPQPPDHAALGLGGMGRIRILRVPFPLIFGGCVSICWPPRQVCRSPGAVAPAKQDERDIALDMVANAGLARVGQTIIADKGYRRASFEKTLNEAGITLIRPATKSEKPRPGRRFLRPFRQIIESVNNTLKTQLDLERYGGRTKAGVIARVLQRLLALTAAIWHHQTTNRPGPARSLIAYDH